jgi:prepilin-type N-terminal cleavage/methylation domain-containing protein
VSANKRRLNWGGFTLVELMVVVTLVSIIGVVFLGLSVNYFVTITRNNQLTEMTVDSQNLLRSTVENIRFGDGVRQTNQINDPNAPSGGWNTSNSAFVIILAVPALDSSHNYITDPNTGSPYMNELVYYKSGKTLMERKLANPAASGNTLHTTCPSSVASASCSADIVLAQNINTMTFTLYDQDDNQTTTASQARSVKITLDMRKTSPSLHLTTTMRVTLRNRF